MQWFPWLVTFGGLLLLMWGDDNFQQVFCISLYSTLIPSIKQKQTESIKDLNRPKHPSSLRWGKSLLKRPCPWQLSSCFSDGVAVFVLIPRAQVWNMSPFQDPSLSLSQTAEDREHFHYTSCWGQCRRFVVSTLTTAYIACVLYESRQNINNAWRREAALSHPSIFILFKRWIKGSKWWRTYLHTYSSDGSY